MAAQVFKSRRRMLQYYRSINHDDFGVLLEQAQKIVPFAIPVFTRQHIECVVQVVPDEAAHGLAGHETRVDLAPWNIFGAFGRAQCVELNQKPIISFIDPLKYTF